MAIKKRESRQSLGMKSAIHKRQEEKRQARFAARREAGKAYEYKPNPFKKGTAKWYAENATRAEKNKSSKLPYARLTSIFAKLDNEIAKKKEAEVKEKAKIKAVK